MLSRKVVKAISKSVLAQQKRFRPSVAAAAQVCVDVSGCSGRVLKNAEPGSFG